MPGEATSCGVAAGTVASVSLSPRPASRSTPRRRSKHRRGAVRPVNRCAEQHSELLRAICENPSVNRHARRAQPSGVPAAQDHSDQKSRCGVSSSVGSRQLPGPASPATFLRDVNTLIVTLMSTAPRIESTSSHMTCDCPRGPNRHGDRSRTHLDHDSVPIMLRRRTSRRSILSWTHVVAAKGGQSSSVVLRAPPI
jgi:hypothetical protein